MLGTRLSFFLVKTMSGSTDHELAGDTEQGTWIR